MRLTLFGIIALALISCANEPELEFADWLIPVPEGTPIHEYAPVPLEGRDPAAVQLVEDLVIGGDPSNPQAVLYEPGSVAASADGTIYIADRGANDIKMFAADGTWLKTLGKEGQGPGEFGLISSITIAGDRLVVNDLRNRRASVWKLDGEHVADYAPSERFSMSLMQGLDDGTLVSYYTERDEDRSGRRVVVRRTFEGEQVARLLETPLPPPSSVPNMEPRAILQNALDSFDNPRISLSVGSGEVVYISPMHEYQLLAMSAAGEVKWALRAAWERFPWPEISKQAMIDSFEDSFQVDEPMKPEDLRWPERYTALYRISTDGGGRVYVFPQQPPTSVDEPPETYPVDVYSPQGEFITAGIVDDTWSYALGDYVYGSRPNENDETVVVRYRVVVGHN